MGLVYIKLLVFTEVFLERSPTFEKIEFLVSNYEG